MKEKLIAFSVLAALLFVALPAGAMQSVPAEVAPSGTSVVIPERAVAVAPHVFSLGSSVDPQSGRVVEGFAIVHPREHSARPDNPGNGKGGGNGGGDKGGKQNQCFAVLAKGAAWNVAEPWVLNGANSQGLTEAFLLDTVSGAIDEWEDAADGVLDSVQGADIFGSGVLTTDALIADMDTPDGVNEVYFGNIADSGVIAVTITWGIFGGPPSGRELVEWDQVYDEVDFAWANDGTPSAMDFENIAQHELGHALGLGHPDDSCTEETMFRFASLGEIAKRTLEAGDIAGTAELY